MKKTPLNVKLLLLRIKSRKRTGSNLLFTLVPFLFFSSMHMQSRAQSLDVPYVPTPQNVVEKMLDMANVGPGDYVIDLGSGDGRIVIAAAKRGAFGHGVDIDPVRIKEASENAKKAEVENKVLFVQDNIFSTDFSRASVVTMYLLNSVNLQLRSHLLGRLKPGTRIVSHNFDMGDWKPDNNVREETSNIYFWLIPANVKGEWNWQTGEKSFTMTAQQEYQKIRLQIKSGRISLPVEEAILNGDRISFTVAVPKSDEKYLYSGRVEGNRITGVAQIRLGENSSVVEWNAVMR
jgi:SAM-dependent methyltransferase